MSEMARVAAPGGRIILVTWCIRALAPGETDYSESEKQLLTRLCDAYYLPQWCSVDKYAQLAQELGLRDVRLEDWSVEVQPFWRAVIDTALTWRGFVGLLKSGPTTIQGAAAARIALHPYLRSTDALETKRRRAGHAADAAGPAPRPDQVQPHDLRQSVKRRLIASRFVASNAAWLLGQAGAP